MSCGVAAILAGFLITTFKGRAAQQEALPVGLPTTPTTLEHQCVWMDRLALPVSSIVDIPANPPLSVPSPNPFQCLRAEQLSFVNWSASPPVVETLSSQPQSKWLDHLALFDHRGTELTGPDETAGYVTPFNIFSLMVAVIAFISLLRLSRWVWRCREELAPYLLITTLLATREASLAMLPIHAMYHGGVSSAPYFCSIALRGLRQALLLRDPVSHNDYQILLDRVDSLTESLATINAAKETAEKDHYEAATTSVTKITDLENQLSKEQSKAAKLTVESEKVSSDMETLSAKNHSLTTTTHSLTETIADLREEQESKARSHHEALEKHTLEILEHKAALASATKRAEDRTNDVGVKATEVEVLKTRIANMQQGFDTSCKEQATIATQLSDTADELAFEKQSLTAENIAVSAENIDLQQQLTTLVKEKAVYVEDQNSRTSEVAELKAALSLEKNQNDRHVEQAEAEAAEIVQLRNTIAFLRDELAAVDAHPPNERDTPPPHLAPAQSSVHIHVTKHEDIMAADNGDRVDNAPQVENPLESQMPTDLIASSSSSRTGAVTAIDHVTPIIDTEVVIAPPAEHPLSGTELRGFNLNGAESYIVQETHSQNTPFGQENQLPTLFPTALPISPPVTPPGNSAELFTSPSSTGTALEPEATSIDCTTSDASLDPMSLGDVSTPFLLQAPLALVFDPDPAPMVERPTVGLPQAGSMLRTNPRGSRSLVSAAMRAADIRRDAPTSSRTPTAPIVTPRTDTRPHSRDLPVGRVYPPISGNNLVGPGASIKPHSWDQPASRVYPPGSDNNPARGRSATQPKGHVPKLGKHFHREKAQRPPRSIPPQSPAT